MKFDNCAAIFLQATLSSQIINCCSENELKQSLINAYLAIQSKKKPSVYHIKLSYIMLKLRRESKWWSDQQMSPISYYISVDIDRFSTPMEFVHYAMEITKNQFRNSDFSRPDDPKDMNWLLKSQGNCKKSFFMFLITCLFVALYWTFISLGILLCLVIAYTYYFQEVPDPTTFWFDFF